MKLKQHWQAFKRDIKQDSSWKLSQIKSAGLADFAFAFVATVVFFVLGWMAL